MATLSDVELGAYTGASLADSVEVAHVRSYAEHIARGIADQDLGPVDRSYTVMLLTMTADLAESDAELGRAMRSRLLDTLYRVSRLLDAVPSDAGYARAAEVLRNV